MVGQSPTLGLSRQIRGGVRNVSGDKARWVPLAATAGAAVACAALAAVDPGRLPAGVPCPLRLTTGLDCPFCGATRATRHLLHGDVVAAADLNLLWLVALPVVVVLWTRWVVGAVRGRPRPVVLHRPALMGVGLLLLLFTAVRNLPVAGLAWLGT